LPAAVAPAEVASYQSDRKEKSYLKSLLIHRLDAIVSFKSFGIINSTNLMFPQNGN
jgi:hypothetical protein